jgi:hypothetical protein
MPAAFTEMVIARNAVRDFATAEFLDIFHHRLLSLFYLGRKRHRPSVGGDANTASVGSATRRLCGSTEQVPRDAGRWLRHAGLLAGAPRSTASLCTLLADRFQIAFRAEQFVGRWLALESDDLTLLGDTAHQVSTWHIVGVMSISDDQAYEMMMDDWDDRITACFATDPTSGTSATVTTASISGTLYCQANGGTFGRYGYYHLDPAFDGSAGSGVGDAVTVGGGKAGGTGGISGGAAAGAGSDGSITIEW